MFGSEYHKANIELIKICVSKAKNTKMASLMKKLILYSMSIQLEE